MTTTHVPVVIVGAGPTGASAAIMLAQRGVECLLLDRWRDVYPLPRAVHFDDEVFRIFAQMGIAEQVRAISRPLPGMQLVDARHRVLAELTRDPSGQVHGYPAGQHVPPAGARAACSAIGWPSCRRCDFRGNVEVIAVEPGAHGEEPVRVRTGTSAPAPRPRCGPTPCWAATARTASPAPPSARPWRTSASPSNGSSSTCTAPSGSTPTTESSRSATTTAPPPSCG